MAIRSLYLKKESILMKKQLPKFQFLAAMGVFGTIGLCLRYIGLSSAAVSFCRGVLGCAFLLLFMLVTRKRFDRPAVKRNALLLCLSGAAIGVNWVLLFEAYRYTTVATATACYYMAPLFLLLASPLIGERLTVKKLLCIAVALVGMVFVSGVMDTGIPQLSELTGVLCGVGAAVFYATVMVLNKNLKPIPAYDKTAIQLAVAALVVLPYMLLTGGTDISGMTPLGWVLLAVVGIVHTGLSYTMYFGAMGKLPATTVAVFSYLDPVIAVLLSALVLREEMTGWGIAGTAMILAAALYSELPPLKRKKAE